MGMHTLDDLMLKWQHEKLTAEQMIGQLSQHIGVLYERLRLVERQLGSMEAQSPQHQAMPKSPVKREGEKAKPIHPLALAHLASGHPLSLQRNQLS